MSLTIVKGSPLSYHREMLVKLGLDLLKEDTKRLFFIVPDHIKFQEEVTLLKKIKEVTGQNSFTHAQVFSFSRLAWFYLKNTSYYGNQSLSEVGRPLLIKKVLLESQDQLRLLKTQMDSPGFIAQLEELFKEWQQGEILSEDLDKITSLKSMKLGEKEKINELKILYTAYLNELPKYHFQDQSLLHALKEHFKKEPCEKDGFIFYGFQHLAKEELDVMETLLENNHPVILDRVCDSRVSPYLHTLNKESEYLVNFATEKGITHWEQEVFPGEDTLGEKIALYWGQSFTKVPKVTTSHMSDYLEVVEAKTPYEEVVAIAKKIRHLMTQGVRYKEITLYLRDFDLYEELLENVFAQNNIPLMVGNTQFMAQHPLMAFLESLFLVYEGNFRYQDVARLLKSGFLILGKKEELSEELPKEELTEEEEVLVWEKEQKDMEERVDIFENILLKNDFSGRDFTQGPWHLISLGTNEDLLPQDVYEKEKALENFSNDFKEELVHLLVPFYNTLKKAKTGKEAAITFYNFLIKAHIKEQMTLYAKRATLKGDLAQGKNHEQTWDALCELLNEYVTIFGEEDFHYEDFRQLFSTGLKELSYDQIPQTLDQVQAIRLEDVQVKKSDYVFALGLDEDTLPKKIQNNTLLTDEERRKITEEKEFELSLVFEAEKESQKENLYLYYLLLSANKKLFFSYPQQKEKGLVKISSFLPRLLKPFGISVHSLGDIAEKENEQQTLGRISTYAQLIQDYSGVKNLTVDNLNNFWLSVPQILAQSPLKELFNNLEKSWAKKNIPTSLSETTAKNLYGKELYASVSKMESFYACEYQFFLNYGLKLQERELFGLNPLVTGQFFHEVLDELFKIVLTNEQVKNLSENELNLFFHDALNLVLQEKKYSVFSKSLRMDYLKNKLIATLHQLVKAINWQQKITKSQPISTEWRFGFGQGDLRGLDFSLDQEKKLFLRGIIDRVDLTEVDEKAYLTVIDYKSSEHKFDLPDAYYGLSMQLLTYLEVLSQKENKNKLLAHLKVPKNQLVLPGGALYLQIKNPELKPKDDLETDTLKAFKYQGFLVADEEDEDYLENLNPNLSGSSLIYPVKGLKAGLKVLDSQHLTSKELSLLQEKNQRNLTQAAKNILQGKIHLNPSYHDKKTIVCTYCPFRSICRFDVLNKENNYRQIEKLSKKEVMEKISEELSQGKEEEK